MCEGNDDQLVVAHEVEDPIGEHVNMTAPYYGQPTPARKRRPRVGVPQHVLDGSRDSRIELIPKSSLPNLAVPNGIEKLCVSLGVNAWAKRHLRRLSRTTRALAHVCWKLPNSTLPSRMSSTREPISSRQAASTPN